MAPDSQAETYAALHLEIDSWRWAGVPFFLRTGKNLMRKASEITLGSLRVQSQLDFLIEHYSGRAAARLDSEVRIALRMGIYQLRYLDRIPEDPVAAADSSSVFEVRLDPKLSGAGGSRRG